MNPYNTPGAPVADAPATEAARNTARLLYIIHGCTFVFSLGLLSIIPLMINYANRPGTAGTMVYSHHTWMIRSFWWYAAWMAIGWILFATLIGIVFAVIVWGVAWLWKAYRLIRGFIDLNENKAMAV
jgi:uncharacterized membrane protein